MQLVDKVVYLQYNEFKRKKMHFLLLSNDPYFKDCKYKESSKKQIIFYFKCCKN